MKMTRSAAAATWLVSALLLAACGTATRAIAPAGVPWVSTPGAAWMAADATTAPPCVTADLKIVDQKWDGVWDGHATGSMSVGNQGASACALQAPTAITATKDDGTSARADLPSTPPSPIVLAPEDAASVTVTAGTCDAPTATSTRIEFDFADATVMADPASVQVQCGLTLSDFSDEGLVAPPVPAVSTLTVTVSSLPQQVAPGAATSFLVTLANPTGRRISLANCPSYQELIKGDPASVQTFQLNCRGANDAVGAHRKVTFVMHFQVPASASEGTAFLIWRLLVPNNPHNGRQAATGVTKVS